MGLQSYTTPRQGIVWNIDLGLNGTKLGGGASGNRGYSLAHFGKVTQKFEIEGSKAGGIPWVLINNSGISTLTFTLIGTPGGIPCLLKNTR